MNQFEKRMNALRRQFAAERAQITKDACRSIVHLNNAISQSAFPEVRHVLRAEKERLYEDMRTAHKYNRLCYLQQIEMVEDEYHSYREANPSGRQLRRMAKILYNATVAKGQKSIAIHFDDDQQGKITFSR